MEINKVHLNRLGGQAFFDRWTVIGPPFPQSRKSDKADEWFVPCKCKCGITRAVGIAHLVNGHSRSCGCRTGDVAKNRGRTHGLSHTRIYKNWAAMKQRCYNPKNTNYASYGGCGIVVCDSWKDSFEAFRSWAESNGYTPSLQLDRIDNNGPYSPENCRWVTDSLNKRNTQQNHWITAFGETKCVEDWCRDHRCSVGPGALRHRIVVLKMNAEDAIISPRKTMKSRSNYTPRIRKRHT